MGITIFFFIAFIIYFIPSIVGSKHRQAGAIFVLNFLLGWTFVGWVIALVWALTDDKKVSAPKEVESTINTSKSQFVGVADELEKLKQLKDKGVISEEEYKIQKEKILNL